MTDTQNRLGTALLKSLVELKEHKGELNIEDVGALFEKMATSISEETETESFIRKEIEKIAKYISMALHEIATMSPAEDEPEDEPSIQNLNYANAELAAVVAATEEATNNILDAIDEIQDKVSGIDGNEESKQAIMDATTKVYDACNFQDITGQRINKVLKTLDYLSMKIDKLRQFMEERVSADDENDEIVEKLRDKRPDAELMNGPQLEKPSQDDIDKLFASS